MKIDQLGAGTLYGLARVVHATAKVGIRKLMTYTTDVFEHAITTDADVPPTTRGRGGAPLVEYGGFVTHVANEHFLHDQVVHPHDESDVVAVLSHAPALHRIVGTCEKQVTGTMLLKKQTSGKVAGMNVPESHGSQLA